MSAPRVTLEAVVLEDIARRCVGGSLRLPCAARVLRSLPPSADGRVEMLEDVRREIAAARWFGMSTDCGDQIAGAVALVMAGRVQAAAATLAHLDSACSESESDDDFVAAAAAEWATEQGVEIAWEAA